MDVWLLCAAVLTHSNGVDIANPAVDNIPLLVDVAATTCTQARASTRQLFGIT